MSYWKQFAKHRLGLISLFVIFLFCLVGIYAPFLASSKPLAVMYQGEWYFPLFRYLFFTGFYTKPIDIFFNLLIFTFPVGLILSLLPKRKLTLTLLIAVQVFGFFYLYLRKPDDPSVNPQLNKQKQRAMLQLKEPPSWEFELSYMTPYARLNALLRYHQEKLQNERMEKYQEAFTAVMEKRWLSLQVRERRMRMLTSGVPPEMIPPDEKLQELIKSELDEEEREHLFAIPTLWNQRQRNDQRRIESLQEQLIISSSNERARIELEAIIDREEWYREQSQYLENIIMPLLREFHWEEDAGGGQTLNQYIEWWDLTRINRKDMMAALIFGVRISLVVGFLAVGLALAIGIPIGAMAGFYAGRVDIVVSRLLEIWESMPLFFMLLLIVAITQNKSIFLIISVIGLFSWTSFSRYIRAEFFKQRNLSYVEACRAQGFSNRHIIFSHILPNAIPPLLTLLPFAMMGAITSEAALSFLGLGEEGTSSWGVLMDEGRSAFPGESYLLWPPAILLTILLVAIALVGDALRDTLDPKMHK